MENKAKTNLLFKLLNNGGNGVYEKDEIINDDFIDFFYDTMRWLKPEDLHEIIYYLYLSVLYNQNDIDDLLDNLNDCDIIDYDVVSELEENEVYENETICSKSDL